MPGKFLCCRTCFVLWYPSRLKGLIGFREHNGHDTLPYQRIIQKVNGKEGQVTARLLRRQHPGHRRGLLISGPQVRSLYDPPFFKQVRPSIGHASGQEILPACPVPFSREEKSGRAAAKRCLFKHFEVALKDLRILNVGIVFPEVLGLFELHGRCLVLLRLVQRECKVVVRFR